MASLVAAILIRTHFREHYQPPFTGKECRLLSLPTHNPRTIRGHINFIQFKIMDFRYEIKFLNSLLKSETDCRVLRNQLTIQKPKYTKMI